MHQKAGDSLELLELQNMENVRALLSELDVEYEKTSMATEITRLWADFLDDTWVWGGMFIFWSITIDLHIRCSM